MATVVQYSRLGGPEVLEVVEVPTPSADAGELVVELRAVGVNPIDSKLRAGIRPSPPIVEPRRLGSDGSGVVAEVGDGVQGWTVGDEVVVRGASGTYASHVVVQPSALVHKPASVGWAEAAALGVPVGTAYQALRSLGVTEGTTLLIHGGSGGVGQAAIQLAVLWGARVIATSSAANSGRLGELGATAVVYGDGLEQRVRDAAPEGVDLILDAAGTDEAIDVSLALVDDPQRIGTLVVGARAASLGIKAWSGGNPVPLTADELALRAEAVPAVLDLIAAGSFVVEISKELPLADAAEAQRESESGHVRGKIVLLP